MKFDDIVQILMPLPQRFIVTTAWYYPIEAPIEHVWVVLKISKRARAVGFWHGSHKTTEREKK